jgi:hypothetical protein
VTWKVTKDTLAEPGDRPGTNLNAVGMMGPHGCKVLTDAEMPNRFRMYDDDGVLYYEGITDADLENGDEDDVFAPLNDFGTPNAGATRIDYWIAGKWVTV